VRDLVHDLLGAEEMAEGLLVSVVVECSLEALPLGVR
jgi:hypothetical protein